MESTEIKTFTFNEGLYEHIVGSDDCGECWNDRTFACPCGGRIHSEFLDEDYDGYYLTYKCDVCGCKDEPSSYANGV
jgi:hypothetical protein